MSWQIGYIVVFVSAPLAILGYKGKIARLGLLLVLLGGISNLAARASNDGKMPVYEASRIGQQNPHDGRHVDMTPLSKLKPLSDIIYIPTLAIASIGDVLIFGGFILFITRREQDGK